MSDLKVVVTPNYNEKYPHVTQLHPMIEGFNSHCRNIIAIVDLSLQGFSTVWVYAPSPHTHIRTIFVLHFQRDQKLLGTNWWLNYSKYQDIMRNIVPSAIKHFVQDSAESTQTIVVNAILSYIEVNEAVSDRLSENEDVADTFAEGYNETDSERCH